MPIIQRVTREPRELKALTIVGLNQVKRISSKHYRVKSQTSKTWYNVTFDESTGWTCECKDHVFRHTECKHIISCYLSKELRHKIIANSDVDTFETNLEFSCKCGSTNFRKDGIRKNKECEIQRYRCLECNKRFCNNIGLRSKVSAKVITASLDLYFKGVSLRQVKHHLNMFYNVSITHVAIYKWIRKFGEIVTPYVDSLTPPNLSGVQHVDEMMVHIRKEKLPKGHYQWLWNLMDASTRYWITSKISSDRKVDDAVAVFHDAKTKVGKPIAIVHDGLHSYNVAYRKEFWTIPQPRTQNIRSISVRHKGLNQKIERLNGIVRDREKVMRGMDHKESAQKLMEAYRVYYNYIRIHGSLQKTPAQEAGLKMELGNNPFSSLIQYANSYARSAATKKGRSA